MIISALIIPSISSAYENEKSADEFNATLGLGAISTPKYSGSNEQSWGAIPLIHLQYNNYFLDSMNGLGAHWQSDNGLYIEPTLGYSSGRTDKNSGLRKGSDKLKGMGEISGAVNSSLALGWAVKPWLVLEGKAILPLSESQGASYKASVSYLPIISEENNVTFQTSALFADSRFINTWYGVNTEQSAHSGYAHYHSSAGIYGYDASLSWGHQFSEHWGGFLSVNYTWLTKSAANSPIVMQRGGTTGIVAVSYRF